jgi:hypothetical protein
MGWMTNLRILGYCRRFVRAQESIAESLRTLAHLASEDWTERHAPKQQSKANIAYFDPRAASDRWEREREEAMRED